LVAAVAGLLAGWSYYRHRPITAEIAGGFALLVLIASLRATWARRFHNAWMTLASVLGYVNSRILLGLIYLVAIVPTGLTMRITGFDPLSRRGKQKLSYWVARTHTKQTKDQFELTF
jgi:hypothetical protein